MPTIPQSELPRPKSWDEFEDIVWDLFARAWNDPNAQRYGRSGQTQQGVDIYGRPPHLEGRYAGVQCKLCEPGKLTRPLIEAEIAKAETFVPPLAEYTIATTHPRDAALQHIIRDINEEHAKKSQFVVHVVFWEDICSRLAHSNNRDLLQKHYGAWQPADLATRPTLTAEKYRELEHDYIKQVAEECRYLYTEGVDRVRAELTDVFVMLQAVQGPLPEERTDVAPVPMRAEEMGLLERPTGRRERRETTKPDRAKPPTPPPPPVPLSNALTEQKHLVILGEPGTGKSTTLQFVALCFARSEEGWPRQRLGLDEKRVPVRIELRPYDGLERLDRFLVRWLDTQYYVPETLAQEWLKEGRLAVLLDGLDEVPYEHRSDVVRALEGFVVSAEGKACRIVVSSRIAGYQRTRELGGDFGHYTICPFAGPEDALLYTAGWLRPFRGTTDEEAKAEARNLLEQMEEQIGLRRVRSNPLLLRLIVTVYIKTGELARNRAEVYRRYVDEVVWQRVEGREQPRWSRETIEAAVEAVAWTLQIYGGQTKASLANAATESVEGLADARHLVHYLQERLGLLAAYGYEQGELIAFRHLTFREYFVARRLAQAWRGDRRRAWRFLRPRLHLSTWRESILLLLGMLGPESATELVSDILQARSTYERELRRDLLLAGESLTAGVGVTSRLRHEVLDRLLALYVRQVVSGSTETYRRLITQPIEAILASLPCGDRDYIRDSLLTVAQGAARSGPAAPDEIRLDPEVRRYAAIRVLGDLNMRAPELTAMLLMDLDDVSTRYAAAASLGLLNLGTREVGAALVDVMQQEIDTNGWNSIVAKIAEVLGALGQRHPVVVEQLLGIAEGPALDSDHFRDAITQALFKAAGTDRRAMSYIFRRWRRYDACESEYDRIREGWELRDGDKLIDSASLEVIRYLLDMIRDCSDRHTREKAAQFLDQVVGDSPLVSCLVVERDGSLHHQTVDLTEELFDIFLRRPNVQPFGGGGTALPILVRWSQSRPELTARLINVVQGADPWILAHMIEWENIEQSGTQSASIPEETITALRQSVANLRSPDEAERESELIRWVSAAESAPAEHWHLRRLPPGVQAWKCQNLSNAYNILWSNLWPGLESRPRQLPVGMTPYVIAALACFRGWTWNPGYSLPSAMTADDLRDGYQVQAERALSILQSRDGQAIKVLSAIVAGESSGSVSADLVKRLGDELGKWEVQRWHRERGPGPRERGVAAHALAEMARDHPEVQEMLLSSLDSQFWYQDVDDPKVEFQVFSIGALGYVRRANTRVAGILLEIASSHKTDAGYAAIDALGQLPDPSPEAVRLLVAGYERLDEYGQAYLVKGLGMAESSHRLVLPLLLSALKARQKSVRSAAAIALGNLGEPSPEILDALLVSLVDNLAAAEAVGKLASCLAPGRIPGMVARLRKAAKKLRKVMLQRAPRPPRRPPPLPKPGGGPDFMLGRWREDLAHEALDKVVAKLTELETRAVGDGPPLSAPPMELRALSVFLIVLGVIAAAVSGLASNIIATFLQDRLGLITDTWRISIVVAVFLLTLAVAIWLAFRQQRTAKKEP